MSGNKKGIGNFDNNSIESEDLYGLPRITIDSKLTYKYDINKLTKSQEKKFFRKFLIIFDKRKIKMKAFVTPQFSYYFLWCVCSRAKYLVKI